MLKHLRAFFSTAFTPIARFLLRIGLTPNAVTVIGTAGVSLGALIFYPLGELFWGTLLITLFVFSDLIDGLMARLGEKSSVLGGFLDSVSDRVQDSAVFLGLMLWFFGSGENYWIGVAAAVCMILGLLVSYIRARAESEGYDANTGIAERPERMVLALVFTGFVGLGLPEVVLLVVLALLAAASLITVIQRITTVVRQAGAGS
ncbi:phosphatidylinositol phosphate synthase [Nesterenkonia alkaliphila]|uniref:Phosphatidylinositol phosphate synthase n=1 Tax=Nesterenkonia alkaliphila TaxID=1463631 RepID=A0A7K1UM27_9MICC|nr:CDP-alcohol phosphatidyltransferase family protein [Nesterenkonia alkaliphila]MVT27535.1 CDP-alcohol phosphatidyltransferase family protein [Nesterenkonia alkaliphila]GFZ80254.1 CDP-alcohol phosphatidyltransferase [Nesterenkonia alkaliphila]